MTSKSIFSNTSLCVVGNINRDIKTAPLAAGQHLFQDGETSVEAISETVGGGGANSAFAAAYLGAKTAFLGKVGRDALGDRLEHTLIKHSISPTLARGDAPTGTSINLTFSNGHRHFVSCLPNNESLHFDDLNLKALSGCKHLLRADVWFSEPMLQGGNERLFRAAHDAGLDISLDLNWDPHWGRGDVARIRARKESVRSLLKLTTLAHGNVRELKEFTDADNLETALRRLEEWGAKAVVVHLGADGAGYYHVGRFVVEPSVPAKTRINTTGTGDVLSTCLMLSRQLSWITIQEQLKKANTIVSEFIGGQYQMIPAIA